MVCICLILPPSPRLDVNLLAAEESDAIRSVLFTPNHEVMTTVADLYKNPPQNMTQRCLESLYDTRFPSSIALASSVAARQLLSAVACVWLGS